MRYFFYTNLGPERQYSNNVIIDKLANRFRIVLFLRQNSKGGDDVKKMAQESVLGLMMFPRDLQTFFQKRHYRDLALAMRHPIQTIFYLLTGVHRPERTS